MTESLVTRSEHIEWCKQRALQFLDTGDWFQALASLQSDLTKNPKTVNHGAIQLASSLALNRYLNSCDSVRNFIEGVQ